MYTDIHMNIDSAPHPLVAKETSEKARTHVPRVEKRVYKYSLVAMGEFKKKGKFYERF